MRYGYGFCEAGRTRQTDIWDDNIITTTIQCKLKYRNSNFNLEIELKFTIGFKLTIVM